MPTPRKLLIEDRFALSNEVLKTKSKPALRACWAHSRAIIMACSSDSITHGPAMIVSRPSPNVALPTLKGFVELLKSFMCVAAFQLPLTRRCGTASAISYRSRQGYCQLCARIRVMPRPCAVEIHAGRYKER